MKNLHNEPLHLIEDENTGDRFLVYANSDGLNIDIKYEGETLWMPQTQIAELFGKERSNITRHINNIIDDGELSEDTFVQKMHKSTGRPLTLYNLDMIISVGYRVSSSQATLFRRWATGILVQFAKRGFVVDSKRLKQPENNDRVQELREIIRDIRSDEANVYRELKSICAMCKDYDPNSENARQFYQRTQAKLVYAVTSNTPAELIIERANHAKEDMGLQTWPNEKIRKSDVTVSKNFLSEIEIKELNRLTTILLDIFEDQLDLGRISIMNDAQELLDAQLKQLGRAVLKSGGSVKASQAKKHAEVQYSKFDKKRKMLNHQRADENINRLARQAKELPRTRKPTD